MELEQEKNSSKMTVLEVNNSIFNIIEPKSIFAIYKRCYWEDTDITEKADEHVEQRKANQRKFCAKEVHERVVQRRAGPISHHLSDLEDTFKRSDYLKYLKANVMKLKIWCLEWMKQILKYNVI